MSTQRIFEGALQKLHWHADHLEDHMEAQLPVGSETLNLKALIGKTLRIEFSGEIRCQHCDRVTRKSFSQGYCYPCFRRLARCDLCIVSPTRCHFDQGTCREPEWAEGFCFSPHSVYLANASGLKVGITGQGREPVRWMDQGARQAQVLLHCDTRQLAGEIEARLSKTMSDRTQWRKLISEDAPSLDLAAARDAALAVLGDLPAGARVATQPEQAFRYPVERYGKTKTLNLDKTPRLDEPLLGIKGQYLLFESGAFNVRKHTGYCVRIEIQSRPPSSSQPVQQEIF